MCYYLNVQFQGQRVKNAMHFSSRSQWPRGLRCGSAPDRLLGLRIRIPPRACITVVIVMYFLVEVSSSGWSLVLRSLIRCGLSECDGKTSIMRSPWSTGCCCAMGWKILYFNIIVMIKLPNKNWSKLIQYTWLVAHKIAFRYIVLLLCFIFCFLFVFYMITGERF